MRTVSLVVTKPSSLIPHPPSPRFAALPPLALYIHIPWCARKCPYCDFNSHEARGAVPEARYVAALLADLEQALPAVWGRRVYSVFFGGGTPSLFSARTIDAVLAAVRARLPLAPDAEITLEANPGTVEAGKFREFRAAGVNRLSVGIQSFEPRHLKTLGRIHDGREARSAIEVARASFENFNLDLMYGLPGQTPDEARADIEAALGYDPPHLSCYHLTIEPNTYFHRHPPALPDDDAAAAMQEGNEAELAARGYEHYETSAWARPGRRCAHNLNYWTFGDYLGIGAGAHSKLSFPDRIVRQMRVKRPERYLEAAERATPVQEEHAVAAGEIGCEFMMNALRLNQGFPAGLFEERTGLPLTTVLRGLDEAERRGLIERDHARLAPTPLGQRYLNDLIQIFLPEQAVV
ncbi:MAG: oxygen-independent coproporphyrinogen III oxidase-like protein [Betaproteobacteria bacterium]|nr:oxygen-independent coproporphyrinogen III oxidase-like protein [Betaproteobacteria bacterium]MBI2508925.1 oxygen-independent coproporphyrinogen III oxidase-like protein [Betaproteobacteria bacterium]